jgi:hypothetical protein
MQNPENNEDEISPMIKVGINSIRELLGEMNNMKKQYGQEKKVQQE